MNSWHVCVVPPPTGGLVFHDGSVESVLVRFRLYYPTSVLLCVRVHIPADVAGQKYIGCTLRMLAADRPDVDVFLCRDPRRFPQEGNPVRGPRSG